MTEDSIHLARFVDVGVKKIVKNSEKYLNNKSYELFKVSMIGGLSIVFFGFTETGVSQKSSNVVSFLYIDIAWAITCHELSKNI